jgi:acetate kinase
MNALALNAGSSSLKFALFDTAPEPMVSGDIDWADGNRQRAQLTLLANGKTSRSQVQVPDESIAAARAIESVLEAAGIGADGIAVVGHRLVHGGAEFRESMRIDQKVKMALAKLSRLAPLHNPPALKVVETVEAVLPGVPQVAVFDTAFYAQLPPKVFMFPLPYEWHRDWGIRRYGFHGLSHAYCASRAAELLGRPLASLRLISCHLGGGCSATAVRDGVAAATTMGFSPLDGLMMGTRCGSIDPGIILHAQRECGLTAEQIDHALNHRSGLLGISGVSPDLARIEEAAAAGNERARLAFEMFADRVRGAIGALAAGLGGVDALVFTDRIGENSPALRAAACQGLEFMGLRLDAERNRAALPDTDVAAPDSPARIVVVHTREEWMVAREARRVVGCARPRAQRAPNAG